MDCGATLGALVKLTLSLIATFLRSIPAISKARELVREFWKSEVAEIIPLIKF